MRSFTLNLIAGYFAFESVMMTICRSFAFRNPLLARVEIKVLISCFATIMSLE